MKKRLLCSQLPRKGAPTRLNADEAHHASRVLRLRDGETVDALDGQGHQAITRLRLHEGPPRLEYCELLENTPAQIAPHLPLTLAVAVLKGSAMEWCIEKAVELGVETFVPVLTDFTVVQIDKKGPELFRERWQKIADQALKQCGRLHRMVIHLPVPLVTYLQNSPSANLSRFWCDETSRSDAPYLPQALSFSHPVHLLIGPEGGWSPQEIQQLSKSVHTHRIHLGPLILRAETAALFAVSVVAAQFFLTHIHLQPTNLPLLHKPPQSSA